MHKYIITYTTIALFLVGCSSKSNFYQLQPRLSSVKKSTIKKDKIIAVEDVKVAKYLDKPQVITRINDTQVELHELDRWAGDIDTNIQRVITKNLSSKLRAYSVLAKPIQEPIDERYTLYVSIDRFDGDSNGSVVLNGHWSLVDTQNQSLIKGKKFNYTTHIQIPDIVEIVTAQSKLLDKLSSDIASSI